MTTIDPMHTFLLGMVRRETELNLAVMTPGEKCELSRRLKCVRLPYDIGRLPLNIFENDSLNGVSGKLTSPHVQDLACTNSFQRELTDA